jgi:hypothetical protein
MATLAELWEPEALAPVKSAKVPDQTMREKLRMDTLQFEMTEAQKRFAKGDPRAQGDINSLTKEMGGKVARTAPAMASTTAPAMAATSGTLADLWESTPAANEPSAKEEQPKEGGTAVGRMAAQLLGSTQQAKKDLGASVASLADVTLGGIIPGVAGPVTYAGARFFGQSPEQAAALEQKVVGATEKPFGKALGVTETQAYKGEASRQLMDFIGQNINKGAEYIAQKTGLPVADVQNMIGTATVAVAPAVGKAATTNAKAVQEAIPAVGKKLGVGELQVQRPSITQAEAQAQFEAKKTTAGSVGAAAVESATLKQAKANELLIPMGDDYTRSQLTRNPADVRYESDTAKHPIFGVPFQEKYAIQNDKLRKNLQSEVDNTGAEFVGLPSADFGKTVISEPFQKYKSERYQQVSNAYTAADAAGETAQPVSYNNITNFIESETKNRPTRKSENPLYALVEEEIKANDPNGTGQISIRQMEDIRKLIIDEVDPQKKGSVRLGKKLKENIDKATENAGGDKYKEARSLNTKFNEDFEDISVIRDINRNKKGLSDRVIPYEQLADKLVFKGPGSDLKSVLLTFEKMGPEGQQIIKELQGYTADKIMQEATKNVQLDVNNKPYVSTAALNKIVNELEKNGKLEMLFGKKGAERYATLKDVTKELQTVPKDTTNPSGTAASIAAMLLESGVQFGVSGIPAPVVSGATILKNKYDARKQLKKANEYANPTVKISEMIK